MACSRRARPLGRAAALAVLDGASLILSSPLLFSIFLFALPCSSELPAASIVDSWGLGAGMKGNAMDINSRVSSVRVGRGKNPALHLPLDSAWADQVPRSPNQETVDSQVKDVLQTAASFKPGPKDDGTGSHGPEVRGRSGDEHASYGRRQTSSGETTQEKSADATTYIVTKNGRVYLSEKPIDVPAAAAQKSHAQKMMSMAHAKMDAIAKKDKRFADQLTTEAKQLKAAGMGAEGKALEREAEDLLSKLQNMIKNKHKKEQDKASINQRVAEVDKRLSKMKLHGSVVPHKKDIDELRDTSKKEVRKDVKDEDTSIYEYRNGTVWWSRETNSTILNSSAAVAHEVAATGKKKESHSQRFRFINRPDSVVMDSRRHREQAEARLKAKKAGADARAGADASSNTPGAPQTQLKSAKSASGSPAVEVGKAGFDNRSSTPATAPVDAMEESRNKGEKEGVSQPAASAAVMGARWSTAAGRGGTSRSTGEQGGRSVGGAAAGFVPDSKRPLGKQGAPTGASHAAQVRASRETSLGGHEGVRGKAPLSLDIVSGIVAVLVLIVAAVYIKRLFFHGPNTAAEALPAYTSLEGG